MCFTGTEEDQAEQHDQGAIDEVLGDQDMEGGGGALEEADREGDLLEQMSLPGHPESEKERLAYLPKEALVQMLRAARAPQDESVPQRDFEVRVVTIPHKVSPRRT